MKQTTMKALTIAAFFIYSGCGPSGFQSLDVASFSPGLENGLSEILPPTPTPSENIKGFVASGASEGQQVVWLNSAKGELVLSAPLPSGSQLTLLETPIPNLSGARLSTSQNAEGKKTLNLVVPLRHILRNVASIPAQVLPNGDPLPNMPGGELPSYGFSVTGSNSLKAYVYVGSDAVGIFFETNFDPKFSVGVDIRSQNQQKIGAFAVIAAKTPYQSGVFLGVHLDARLARALEKFIR